MAEDDNSDNVPHQDDDVLKKKFQVLKNEVPIHVFTREGVNQPFNRFVVALAKELQKLSPKIPAFFYSLDDDIAKKYDVSRSPTVLIDPDHYHIRYTGSPAGEEIRSFLDAITMLSLRKTFLSEESRKKLSELTEPRHIKVFVSPT